MKKALLILGLIPFLILSQTQIGNRINGENTGDYFGNSISINSDGTIIVVGAPENDDNGNRSGHVRVFEYDGNDWAQLGNTLTGDTEVNAFGSRVSISDDGTIVAVGAHYYNTVDGDFSGQVKVFQYSGGTWSQIGASLYGEGYTHYFGWNLSLSGNGNRLVVSSYNADSVNGAQSGRVYGYEYDSNTNLWVQLGATIQGPTGAKLGTGLDIDYDGSNIVAGGYSYNPYQGIVQTFNYDGNNWVQTGTNILGETTSDSFGTSASISADGTRIAIGATGANSYVGNARVFDFDNNTNDWVQLGSNLEGDATSQYYGQSVSLTSDGSRLAVGGTSAVGNNGYIRIFDFDINTNDWVQDGNNLLGEADDLFFGTNVSFNSDGSVLATSTPYTSTSGNYSSEGGATIFGNLSNLGIKNKNSVNVSIYPNPTKDVLYFEFTNILKKPEVIVYDTLGSIVQTNMLVLQNNSASMDVSKLSKGIYLLSIKDEFNNKTIKKLVIK